jgi:hypothetical protein
MTPQQLREALVSQMSLARQRTEMTYYQCKDWATLEKSPDARAAADKGIWVGQVKVKIVSIDSKRVGEMPDLTKAQKPELEAKLAAQAKGALAAGLGFQQKKIEQQITAAKKEADNATASMQSATSDDDRKRFAAQRDAAIQRADKMQADWTKQKEASEKLSVVVEPKNYGDNSYVIRFSGVTPDMLGAQGALNCGWLRKGEVCAWVEVSGNFPEADMAKAMDTFMAAVDEKFIAFDK